MPESLHLIDSEIEFYKPLIALYLKYGSVDQVFSSLYHNTGVSYPHFHRIIKDWGIVKSSGPQSHFSEAVYFLSAMVKERLPLEAVYKKMPPSLKISAATLHRILSYVKRGLTRRHGTALIVSPASNPDIVLIGKDVGTPRLELGKTYGDLSLPMTYSKGGESPHDSILRVLQQEVAATLTLTRELPTDVINDNPIVLFTIDIADVRVKTYKIILPDNLIPRIDSFKLKDLQFVPLTEVAEKNEENHFRAGVSEIAKAYIERGVNNRLSTPHFDCHLNRTLAVLPLYN